MNIEFEIEEGVLANITKSDEYGYTLRVKKLSDENKRGCSIQYYYYPNLITLSRKLVWMGMEGSNLDEVITSLDTTASRIERAIKEIKGMERV